MTSGDGLVVRVRARCGAFSVTEMSALARAAAQHGNGHIDITRRANLQIRGVTEESFPKLIDRLGQLGLLDVSAGVEAIRNFMIAPLTGLDPAAADVRPVVHELARLLATDKSLQALPAKFGYVIDGGGALPLTAERADVLLSALSERDGYAVGLDAESGPRWLGRVNSGRAAEAVATIARTFVDALAGSRRGRMRDATPDQIERIRNAVAPLVSEIEVPAATTHMTLDIARIGHLHLGEGFHVIGVGVPFGRLEAQQLAGLAGIIAAAGGSEVRLSPWRVIYAGVRDAVAAETALAGAADAGLITTATDPLLQVEACPGAPNCPSASLDTRSMGRFMAGEIPRSGFAGTIHVSGCWKGCARSAPAKLTLVASDARYLVVRNGTADGDPVCSLSPDELRAARWRCWIWPRNPRMSEPYPYIRDGAEIYRNSFAIIRAEADLARFTGRAEEGGRAHHPCLRHGRDRARHRRCRPASPTMRAAALLAGAPILCDAKMVAQRHHAQRACRPSNEVVCTLDDPPLPGSRAASATRARRRRWSCGGRIWPAPSSRSATRRRRCSGCSSMLDAGRHAAGRRHRPAGRLRRRGRIEGGAGGSRLAACRS